MDANVSNSPTGDTRVWIVPLLTVLIVGISIAWYLHMRSADYDGDTKEYIKIANGQIAEVRQPFTSRVLHPGLAGFLARTTGVSINAAFFVIEVVSLAVLVSAGLHFVLVQIPSVKLALALVFMPIVLYLFREIYMPDCLHAALTAMFFLLLAHEAWWIAAPLLFVLQVTRESTVLLTFMLAAVAGYRRMWKLVAAAVLFTALGMVVVSHAAHQGLANIHNTNELVYLVGKVPFNFITNVFGLQMWTNTHQEHDPVHWTHEPMFSIELPAWAPTGNMRKIGVYEFNPGFPPQLIRMLLTHLGIVPSIVFYVIAWRRWRLVCDDGLSLVCLVALTYGVASYLLVPCLGSSIVRYVSYAWPLAWVAAPELLVRYFRMNNGLIGRLALLQVIVCWTSWLTLLMFGVPNIPGELIAIAVAVPCHVIAIKTLRQNRLPLDT